jgi:hypothetical protein
MGKAFFGAVLLLLAALLWVTLPRGIKKTCPVCQGQGFLLSQKPIFVGKGKGWEEKDRLLCPFCEGGKISLHELKLRRTQMLHWMVKEQRLQPEILVQRVREGWGEAGLQELHEADFFRAPEAPGKP